MRSSRSALVAAAVLALCACGSPTPPPAEPSLQGRPVREWVQALFSGAQPVRDDAQRVLAEGAKTDAKVVFEALSNALTTLQASPILPIRFQLAIAEAARLGLQEMDTAEAANADLPLFHCRAGALGLRGVQ